LYSAIKSEDTYAGGIRLRLSEQMGLKVTFEGVHGTGGSNVGW